MMRQGAITHQRSSINWGPGKETIDAQTFAEWGGDSLK
jgi:hypothetical protein